jgi:hypothetical protein
LCLFREPNDPRLQTSNCSCVTLSRMPDSLGRLYFETEIGDSFLGTLQFFRRDDRRHPNESNDRFFAPNQRR